MSKVLVVVQKPYFQKNLEKKFGDNENYSFDSLQTIFSVDEEISNIDIKNGSIFVDGTEQNAFVPLELKLFKDSKEKFVINSTDNKINDADFDFILFACDNSLKTFYAIVEYCQRNDIDVNKALYKHIQFFKEDSMDEIVELENVYNFFDMSIDCFKVI
jgi:hypothetical protein